MQLALSWVLKLVRVLSVVLNVAVVVELSRVLNLCGVPGSLQGAEVQRHGTGPPSGGGAWWEASARPLPGCLHLPSLRPVPLAFLGTATYYSASVFAWWRNLFCEEVGCVCNVLCSELPFPSSLRFGSCHLLRETSSGTLSRTPGVCFRHHQNHLMCWVVDLLPISLTRMPAPNVLGTLLIWSLLCVQCPGQCLMHSRHPKTCVQ